MEATAGAKYQTGVMSIIFDSLTNVISDWTLNCLRSKGANTGGIVGVRTPSPPKKKIWTDHPNFLMKNVITVTQQTAVHETGYRPIIRILFCTIT